MNKYRYICLGYFGWWEFTPEEAQSFANTHGVELIGGPIAAVIRPQKEKR